jgi:hypothetical protein
MNRKSKLKKAMLNSLSRYGARLMPQRILFAEINFDFSPPATTAELDEALRELQTDRLIAGLPGGLEEEIRWKITDVGRLALADA